MGPGYAYRDAQNHHLRARLVLCGIALHVTCLPPGRRRASCCGHGHAGACRARTRCNTPGPIGTPGDASRVNPAYWTSRPGRTRPWRHFTGALVSRPCTGWDEMKRCTVLYRSHASGCTPGSTISYFKCCHQPSKLSHARLGARGHLAEFMLCCGRHLLPTCQLQTATCGPVIYPHEIVQIPICEVVKSPHGVVRKLFHTLDWGYNRVRIQG